MLDEITRAAILRACAALERAELPAKFERPEKLHVTVAFLGAVDPERVDAIRDALRAASATLSAFDLVFETVGAFPNDARARLAWVGSRRTDPRFALLARTVRDAVRPFAEPDEKDAILHVTIARFRTAARLPQIPWAEQTMRVEGFSLFESLPGETTTRYEVLETFSLTSHASSPARSK